MSPRNIIGMPPVLRADGVPHYIAPDIFRLHVDLRQRHSLSKAIDSLIGLLDAMEPDPDLEDGGDGEPWLGWPEAYPGRGAAWGLHVTGEDDREAEDEHDEDGGDDEPDEDDEPSLGRLETLHQGPASCGSYMGIVDGEA